jgi:hypothetical protein
MTAKFYLLLNVIAVSRNKKNGTKNVQRSVINQVCINQN